MGSKTWEPHKAKKFARELEFGKSYFIVHDVATNLAPYEDGQLYSEYVFTRRLPITGIPCTESGGMNAVKLCQNFGPVYEQPPAGMRNVATPGPQVAGPLPAGEEFDRRLDADEVDHMEKRSREARDARPKRKVKWF